MRTKGIQAVGTQTREQLFVEIDFPMRVTGFLQTVIDAHHGDYTGQCHQPQEHVHRTVSLAETRFAFVEKSSNTFLPFG